ncbi:hypothetical protein FOIG_11173 [Fusarium odoratissimum NRRL 54006]|uniref:Uncharacterized protein n=1 Tax=Fusarium odoratissimum (strain NRRL 54006) TaxID=1089451 RepID=X0KH15_FUSO5|nr:uncharacterized protein FOIG_11173 [Fusarium odoratissimum NRRL 54006]EXL96204.1 hypothetical protein FOIG_11173 [Fusarium odoratissimum NRRL 54006]
MTFIKLADYLFTRLRQLGVGSIHGIPGGFNFDLQITSSHQGYDGPATPTS